MAIVTMSKLNNRDISKPYIPIGSLVGHHDVATGLSWQSGYSLLSCSKDSTLMLHDTANAERPATTIRTAALRYMVIYFFFFFYCSL